jgi:hypothetical protein
MKILSRIRTMLDQRELAAIKRDDHAERDQAQTTDDMMDNMVTRAQRIVELEHSIEKNNGTASEIESEDSFLGHSFSAELPSNFGIPTPSECKREGIKWPTSTPT